MSNNPYLLAADSPDACIALLRENPSLASGQDEHGYSLIHAAASYNHLDLLRTLVSEFKVPVDLKDEDGETALFVVETVAAAKVLVEELKLDTTIVNDEGQTAREKIESEEDYPEVAEYLKSLEGETSSSTAANGTTNGTTPADLPPAPEGLSVQIGIMNEAEDAGEPDPEFRRRIEELASREDFDTVQGQEALRQLVEDAILGTRQE
ncbi:hypothetical protein B0T20DRAFT_179380 [Sordaria brevicollis]|uniref:Ankyrin repeat protein n=1 Tax=Sordaria brevicollis TaxID=83679 RepID=A0AAE0PHR3_SORBR|nr:hypothetical protein B0T20DRAFT_179380 [Sordaria brevicollis]